MALEIIPADATVFYGDGEPVTTPFIQSINIIRSRGEVGRASVTIRERGSQEDNSTTNLTYGSRQFIIRIGNRVFFQGVIQKINIVAGTECAGEVIIQFNAETLLYKLRNKRVTRRQKLYGLGPLATITSVYQKRELGFDDPPSRYDIDRGESPVTGLVLSTNMAEQTQFLNYGQNNTVANLHPTTKIADPIVGGAAAGGGSFILHTHETLELDERGGGPARAVYGIK